MKTSIQHILVHIGFVLLVLAIPTQLHAFADPGDDPDIPIDGGVSILIAAGVGYGIKKYRDHRKKNTDLPG